MEDEEKQSFKEKSEDDKERYEAEKKNFKAPLFQKKIIIK
jgi:hypothetical protein